MTITLLLERKGLASIFERRAYQQAYAILVGWWVRIGNRPYQSEVRIANRPPIRKSWSIVVRRRMPNNCRNMSIGFLLDTYPRWNYRAAVSDNNGELPTLRVVDSVRTRNFLGVRPVKRPEDPVAFQHSRGRRRENGERSLEAASGVGPTELPQTQSRRLFYLRRTVQTNEYFLKD